MDLGGEEAICGMRSHPGDKLAQSVKKEEEQKEQEHKGGEVDAALKLVESSKKILECPVCYLTCLPPRIWQVTCSLCNIFLN